MFGVNPGQRRQVTPSFKRNITSRFLLLVDAGQKVAALYHANGLFVKRTVYLIGPDGVIRYAKRGKPDPAEVLAAAQ